MTNKEFYRKVERLEEERARVENALFDAGGKVEKAAEIYGVKKKKFKKLCKKHAIRPKDYTPLATEWVKNTRYFEDSRN